MQNLDKINLSTLQDPAEIFELVEFVGNGTLRVAVFFLLVGEREGSEDTWKKTTWRRQGQ